MTSGKYSSIMLALVATMPQVVQAVLDRCITKSDNKTDSELYHVRFHYFQMLAIGVKNKTFLYFLFRSSMTSNGFHSSILLVVVSATASMTRRN